MRQRPEQPHAFEVVLVVAIVLLLAACRQPLVGVRGGMCIFATCELYEIAPGAYAAASSGTNAPKVDELDI